MPLNVFRVHILKDDYQLVEPIHDDIDLFRFDGTPLSETWKPIEMELANPKKKKPDFFGIAASLTAFAIEWDVYKRLSNFLDQAGESLPVTLHGKELMAFNCTDVLNCLDKKKSEYDPDLPSMIERYVFNPKRFNYSLFKIPQTPTTELLTVEGLSSPNDEFKPVVEKLGLKGLRFSKLWSDTDE